MAHPLAGFRSSLIVAGLAGLAALAAESVSRVPVNERAASEALPLELAELQRPDRSDSGAAAGETRLASDPLGARKAVARPGTVAPRGGVPTVSPSGRRGRGLTAILIAEDRSVAVIDDAVVLVGDRLPDGALITEIRSDRVSVVERNGRRRVLTLTSGRR
jgi:hypothetical protein